MLKRFKNKLLIITAALTLSVPILIPIQAAATAAPQTSTCNNVGNNIATGINDTESSTSGNKIICGHGSSITTGVAGLARKVINVFSVIVGIISVIMIVYAGFRYVTSGGESASVSGAKNTLIYALIGLVVVVLAQLIVHYVLNTANTVASPTGLGG